MTYPQVYHSAHSHIIAFGRHRLARVGRAKVAAALRALRAMAKSGTISAERLQWERDHFRFVGHPLKGR